MSPHPTTFDGGGELSTEAALFLYGRGGLRLHTGELWARLEEIDRAVAHFKGNAAIQGIQVYVHRAFLIEEILTPYHAKVWRDRTTMHSREGAEWIVTDSWALEDCPALVPMREVVKRQLDGMIATHHRFPRAPDSEKH